MALVLSSDSAKIGLVITVVTLLSSCLCAPAATSEPWWFQPCIHKIRHERSTSENLNAVKHQMNIFVNQLKKSKDSIDKLYNINKAQEAKTKTLSLKWLKLKRMVQDIRRPKNQLQKVEQFYKALQHFAGTLDVLWKINISTNTVSFNQEKRKNIYNNITYQMRTLLCEVQDNLRANNKPIPPGIPLKKMKIPLTAKKTLDYTEGHLIDVSFFGKTTSFFKRTQKLLKPKVKKSGAAKVSKTKRT